MEWGDFLADTGSLADLLGDADLVHQQMRESIPLLEQFDQTQPFKIGWYIKQG